jgi:hypothetical protein
MKKIQIMKSKNKSNHILILDILILTFKNELLLRYGAIGYYMKEFPEIPEHLILNSLNNYLESEEKFKTSLISTLSKIEISEFLAIRKSVEAFITICSRQMELPSEKSYVRLNYEKLITQIKNKTI